MYHVRHGVCEVSESIISGRDSGINFFLVLESGVFAGHVERGGQQGYSRESILHFRSHSDTSARQSGAFPCEMIPRSSSDRKEQKEVRIENGNRGKG